MKNNRCKKGFTLIELLVVVLIIGILAAIALPQYQKAVEKVKMSEAITNVSMLQRATDMYILEHGQASAELVELPDILAVSGTELTGGEWEENRYLTKNFSYSGVCGSTDYSSYCEIMADKRDDNGNYYMLYLYNVNGVWTIRDCVTQDSDFGRMMCKSVPDWTYHDGEI